MQILDPSHMLVYLHLYIFSKSLHSMDYLQFKIMVTTFCKYRKNVTKGRDVLSKNHLCSWFIYWLELRVRLNSITKETKKGGWTVSTSKPFSWSIGWIGLTSLNQDKSMNKNSQLTKWNEYYFQRNHLYLPYLALIPV